MLILLRVLFLVCTFIWESKFSVAVSEIQLGSRINVVDKDSWVSPNGDFAVGFFNNSDRPNQFSLGIRFYSDSIPVDKQQAVWVAGGDVLVSSASYFELTQNGELVLFDSSLGVTVWSSKTSSLSVVIAHLHDDGNLVLRNSKKVAVWQSFDTPSNILLPGQMFPVFQTLRAASRNSVSSYYSLFLNASGQLNLRWEGSVVYWTSGGPPLCNLSAVLTTDGVFQLLDQRSRPIWSALGVDHNEQVNFRFLRLDVDGNLRLYSWIETLKLWQTVWQAVPNQCHVFATCGTRGICIFDELGSPICQCKFASAVEPGSKCLVPLQEQCKSGTTIVTYKQTSLYGIYPPNDTVIQANLPQCRRLCLEDPLCTATTFTNDGDSAECRLKRTLYVSGYSDPSLSSVSFVKMCLDPVAVVPKVTISSPLRSTPKLSRNLCVSCLIGATSGTVVPFIAIQIAIGLYIYKRRKHALKIKAALQMKNPDSSGLLVLSYQEIVNITENLMHQMGPSIFKGALATSQAVAVKDVRDATIEERKFRSAVSKLGSICHKNLLKIEGYCCDSDHRFLVYEYAKNGSVAKWLGNSKLSKKLSWRKRNDLCLSVAKAISYLHSGCRETVRHGNLKWENVMLDERLKAKVSEFGLESVHSEFSRNDNGAAKDIEEFGKMMVKLLTGHQDVEDDCEWAYKAWFEGEVMSIVDGRIASGVEIVDVERAFRLAFWCIQSDERRRPSMGEVVEVLKGTLTVDPPPPPFSSRGTQVEDELIMSSSEV